MESADIIFRSHVHSIDHNVSIVLDATMPLLHNGRFSFRLKGGIQPDLVRVMVALLRENVDQVEFHPLSTPVFEKV